MASFTFIALPPYAGLPVDGGPHLSRVFDLLEALEPRVIAPIHGPAFTGDTVQALRDFHRTLRIAKPGHMVPGDDTGTAER